MALLDKFRLDNQVAIITGAGKGIGAGIARAFAEAALRFNVTTAFELSHICAPMMVDTAGGGTILNISSIAGHKPTSCFSAYGTAKGALSLLTRELAQEFAPKVRVNAIAVGSTRTDALNTVLTREIEQTMVDLTPMARLGEVEDIALGALYLCSQAGSYVTGTTPVVNNQSHCLQIQMRNQVLQVVRTVVESKLRKFDDRLVQGLQY